jgi:hypothetical protein
MEDGRIGESLSTYRSTTEDGVLIVKTSVWLSVASTFYR